MFESGHVMITTLIIACLVSVAAAAVLKLVVQQNTFTARSATWCSEIPIAEAGIEEAMAHINSRLRTFVTNGWTVSGSNVTKSRYFTNGSASIADGYFYTVISTTKPPVIVSIGYGRVPRQTNYTSRTVLALTKRTPPAWGFVGKTSVSMNGNPYIDSYNSADPNFSTGGKYDPAKRHDWAGVATLGTNNGVINTGGGLIYGSAATGPHGTVSGNVGDGQWLTGGSGQQPGHVTDDFNASITNVALPAGWNSVTAIANATLASVPQTIGGVTYTAVLAAGDYQFSGMTLNNVGGVLVQGKVRIYFTGDFKMSGTASVTLATGASLEMYMGGSMDLSGSCVVNPTGIPANCHIYGLPTCTSMKYAGTAAAYCALYAPQADLTITGDFDFNGSAVGNRLTFSGTADIHQDEGLSIYGPEYQVVAWEELY